MNSSAATVLDLIGKTPIVPLKRITNDKIATIFAKYEAGNPTYSLKDRTALAIVMDLYARNTLRSAKNPQGATAIIMASNGNSAISMAMVCAVKGLALHLFMPENVTTEKKLIPQTYGAHIHDVMSHGNFEAVNEAARAFAKDDRKRIFVSQFDSDAAIVAHETTAREIIADFPDGLDAFVTTVGTAASIAGISRVLKKQWPQILIIAVEPASSAVISGGKAGTSRIQQIGLGFVPTNYKKAHVDRVITVSDEDAYATTRLLSLNEGLLVGISTGANVFAALNLARELGPGKKVLTLLCDQGQRYFSLEKLFKKL